MPASCSRRFARLASNLVVALFHLPLNQLPARFRPPSTLSTNLLPTAPLCLVSYCPLGSAARCGIVFPVGAGPPGKSPNASLSTCSWIFSMLYNTTLTPSSVSCRLRLPLRPRLSLSAQLRTVVYLSTISFIGSLVAVKPIAVRMFSRIIAAF